MCYFWKIIASECLHPEAVKYIYTISVTLNRVTLALCHLLHESSTLMLGLLLYYISTSVCCMLDAIADNWLIIIIMAIILKWNGRLRRGWAEARKLRKL